MPQNLELKIKLDSSEKVESILDENKIELNEILEQKDVYYCINTGLLKLRIEGNNNFLIKYLRDEIHPDRWSDYEIIQLNSDNVENFLSDIFTVEATVIKTRKLYWHLNTRIHVDNVTGLGDFLELETIVNNDQEEAKKRFNKVVAMLRLDLKHQIKCSYRDLILEKIRNDTN